jgi:osmotically-inducible protein OsmY
MPWFLSRFVVPVKTWAGVEGAALTTINSRKIRSRRLYKNDSDQGNFRLLRDTPMLQVLGPRLVARTKSAKSRGSLGAMHTLGGNMRSDSDIKRDVEQELSWDPDIDPTDIAVAVKNGVVTLTGYVRSYAHKFAAERAAKRVVGVVGVANDLEVRLPQVDEKPDPEIARDVVANLKMWLPNSWEHIKAIVKDRWVTLEGEVEWNYQREYAERAVRWIKGVKGVSNLIRLHPRVAPSPTEIKQKIEEAFRRSALIDANRVTVETSGGEVVLRGNVRSWAEREEAERAAWLAPGVIRVDNRIVVSP